MAYTQRVSLNLHQDQRSTRNVTLARLIPSFIVLKTAVLTEELRTRDMVALEQAPLCALRRPLLSLLVSVQHGFRLHTDAQAALMIFECQMSFHRGFVKYSIRLYGEVFVEVDQDETLRIRP